MSVSDGDWTKQPRIWRQAPPAWPVQGSWSLVAAMSVKGSGCQVSMHIDGSQDWNGGYLKPVWRSVPIRGVRPLTYTEGIPLLSQALWELSMAFRGMGIRFEQS